jgi:hypothetical protein
VANPLRPALNGSLNHGNDMRSESRAGFQLKISFSGEGFVPERVVPETLSGDLRVLPD